MASLLERAYNPDVLTCLANLSNDEVFTPPELANKVLDLLPEELWSDPSVKILDPFCKSGVFLREAAKRFIKGLEPIYPDLQERVDHIMHEQLFGIAITELTSLLSRRSLYCSKFPNGRFSVSGFDGEEGNIRYRNIQHTWRNKRCIYCGASQDNYDRGEDLETHAYEFIHATHPEEIFDMKFDVIVGNPPYQLSDGGGSGTSAAPLYHRFIQQAIKLSPRYLSMIVPSRWFSGGKGLDSFRSEMLNDNRLKVIHDFIEAADCFPGVQIKGGVCFFLWDRQYHGDCTIVTHRDGKVGSPMTRPLLEADNDVLIRFNEAIPIFHKVHDLGGETLSSLVSARRPFGLPSTYRGHDERRPNDLVLHQSGGVAYVDRGEIADNGCAQRWKVFIPFLGPGNDNFPHMVLGRPFIGAPGEVCTETCLTIGPLNSREECESLLSYIATRFARFLVLLRKPSQNATKKVYGFVPLVTFDRIWTDDELYDRYGISDQEAQFIASLVKEMNLENDE